MTDSRSTENAAPGGTCAADGSVLGQLATEAAHSRFRTGLESLLNRHSMENGCDTPDFILAGYLYDCLQAFDNAMTMRETWYGRRAVPADAPTGDAPND